MGKKDKIRMPSGMAGILRYDQDSKDGIKVKPEHVIAFSIGIIILEFILRFFG